jgi:hypothetical protein
VKGGINLFCRRSIINLSLDKLIIYFYNKMSKYDNIKDLKDEDFRRLTGVRHSTFKKMIEILSNEKNKETRGRKYKLCIEDRLLLELEYLRENRTFYHIATSYGVNESTAIRISHWIEDVLSKCEEFRLPSKREILKDDTKYEVFVIDATESPIERPSIRSKSKKNSKKINKTKIIKKTKEKD